MMNYTNYGGSAPHPQAVTRGLSVADEGGTTPSTDIVTIFALFPILRLPFLRLKVLQITWPGVLVLIYI